MACVLPADRRRVPDLLGIESDIASNDVSGEIGYITRYDQRVNFTSGADVCQSPECGNFIPSPTPCRGSGRCRRAGRRPSLLAPADVIGEPLAGENTGRRRQSVTFDPGRSVSRCRMSPSFEAPLAATPSHERWVEARPRAGAGACLSWVRPSRSFGAGKEFRSPLHRTLSSCAGSFRARPAIA